MIDSRDREGSTGLGNYLPLGEMLQGCSLGRDSPIDGEFAPQAVCESQPHLCRALTAYPTRRSLARHVYAGKTSSVLTAASDLPNFCARVQWLKISFH